MKRSFAAFAVILLTVPSAWGAQMTSRAKEPATLAEQQEQAKPETSKPKTSEVVGKIESVDPSGRHLTLENGFSLSILPSVEIRPGTLKKGMTVWATYQEQIWSGQKFVTFLQVLKNPQS